MKRHLSKPPLLSADLSVDLLVLVQEGEAVNHDENPKLFI